MLILICIAQPVDAQNECATVTAEEGSFAVLQVETTPDAKSVHWRRKGVTTNYGNFTTITEKIIARQQDGETKCLGEYLDRCEISPNYSLTVYRLKKEDNGDFYCHSENEQGLETVKCVTLLISPAANTSGSFSVHHPILNTFWLEVYYLLWYWLKMYYLPLKLLCVL